MYERAGTRKGTSSEYYYNNIRSYCKFSNLLRRRVKRNNDIFKYTLLFSNILHKESNGYLANAITFVMENIFIFRILVSIRDIPTP